MCSWHVNNGKQMLRFWSLSRQTVCLNKHQPSLWANQSQVWVNLGPNSDRGLGVCRFKITAALSEVKTMPRPFRTSTIKNYWRARGWNGFRNIWKSLDVHQSTERQIIEREEAQLLLLFQGAVACKDDRTGSSMKWRIKVSAEDWQASLIFRWCHSMSCIICFRKYENMWLCEW